MQEIQFFNICHDIAILPCGLLKGMREDKTMLILFQAECLESLATNLATWISHDIKYFGRQVLHSD